MSSGGTQQGGTGMSGLGMRSPFSGGYGGQQPGRMYGQMGQMGGGYGGQQPQFNSGWGSLSSFMNSPRMQNFFSGLQNQQQMNSAPGTLAPISAPPGQMGQPGSPQMPMPTQNQQMPTYTPPGQDAGLAPWLQQASSFRQQLNQQRPLSGSSMPGNVALNAQQQQQLMQQHLQQPQTPPVYTQQSPNNGWVGNYNQPQRPIQDGRSLYEQQNNIFPNGQPQQSNYLPPAPTGQVLGGQRQQAGLASLIS